MITAASAPSPRGARQGAREPDGPRLLHLPTRARWTPLAPTSTTASTGASDQPPAGRPAALAELEAAENFPVALRLLPARHRRHLQAVYDVARTVDDLGDEGAGDPAARTAALNAFAADLRAVWRPGGVPHHPVLRRLVPTVRECALEPEPFQRLVQANLQDQAVARYATFADLRGYCVLSADPVGRIVLQVFGQSTPARARRSDLVCTALQVLEHLQDVAEDRARGRVYLPQEDLAAFGVPEADLDRPRSTPRLSALVRWEAERAADLLAQGAPLVGELRGWARIAVAGFVAGGLATVDALLAPGTDVLAATPHPRRADVARHAARLLTRSLPFGLLGASRTGMSLASGPRRRP